MIRRLLLPISVVVLALCLSQSPSQSASLFPDEYDHAIEDAVELYWPDYPVWLAWKAQLYQESLLRPDDRSAAGAEGIAQFMPRTWADITRQLGWGIVDRRLAEPSILAGAYYMRQLRTGWSAPRPIADRNRLAQASYNAGFGNILRAQRHCGGASAWADIAPCLPQVTGPRNAAETTGYVQRIARWLGMMEAGL